MLKLTLPVGTAWRGQAIEMATSSLGQCRLKIWQYYAFSLMLCMCQAELTEEREL